MAKLRGKVLGRLGGFPKLSAPRFCLLHPFPRVRLPPRERETPESPGRKAKVITNQVAQLALVPRAAGHRVVEVARIEAIVGRDPIARAGHHGVIFRRLNIGRELAFPDASGEMLRADPAARGRNIARHRVGEIARFESILGGNPVLVQAVTALSFAVSKSGAGSPCQRRPAKCSVHRMEATACAERGRAKRKRASFISSSERGCRLV